MALDEPFSQNVRTHACIIVFLYSCMSEKDFLLKSYLVIIDEVKNEISFQVFNNPFKGR